MSQRSMIGAAAGVTLGVAAAALTGVAPMLIMMPGTFGMTGALFGLYADMQAERKQTLKHLSIK